MKKENAVSTIISSIVFITILSVTVVVIFNVVSVSAVVSFGIFNYENPYLVQIQALRAHLFETNDASHKSNITETVMHSNMANEEITMLLQNISASETIPKQDSLKLHNTLNLVQMQLSEISTLANNNNMTGVMTNLKHADKQLASLLDTVKAYDDNQTTIKG